MSTPLLRLCALLFAAAMFVPAAAAQAHQHGDYGYGSIPGDPRVLDDGAACFAAAAERSGTVCSVLYAHMFDLLNDFLVNVQRPAECAPDLGQGFSGVVGHENLWDLNELDAYSSPGFVEYPTTSTCPEPRLHKERGITDDVRIDTQVPILGYWYLSADFDELQGVDDVPPDSGQGPDIGALPCLTVRMTLQTGRHWGQGTPLAAGETTKTVVSAQAAGEGQPDPLAEAAPCPGGRTGDIMYPEEATEFEVQLVPLLDELVIPRDDGFLVHVEWYQHAPDGGDAGGKFYMGQFNLRTGSDYPNRVVVPVADAVRFDRFEAIPFDDKLYLQVVANSPWGSYDVDPGTLRLSLFDAAGTEIPIDHLGAPTIKYSVDHNGHFDPLRAAFPWDIERQGLAPGAYTVVATVQNFQHTATARAEATILVEKERVTVPPEPGAMVEPQAGANETTPGPGALLLVVLVGLVVLGRRIRSVRP